MRKRSDGMRFKKAAAWPGTHVFGVFIVIAGWKCVCDKRHGGGCRSGGFSVFGELYLHHPLHKAMHVDGGCAVRKTRLRDERRIV